jgi:hypothetical protein
MSQVLEWISVIAALAAAVLWFMASRVRTPEELRHLFHSPMGGGPFQGDVADLARGVHRQSQLNAFAALCAAVAALSHAASQVLSQLI